MKIDRLLPLVCCLLSFLSVFSQNSQNISLYRGQSILFEKYLHNNTSIHSSIKPLLCTNELDAIRDSINRSITGKMPNTTRPENKISIDAIFESSAGYEVTNTKSPLKKGIEGGLAVQGNRKSKLSWNASFFSGNSSFPAYLDSFIKKSHVIPGTGSAYTEKNGAYSYQYYSGYLSYSPNAIFNFQAGKDKHFWGNGYRSLFLSDLANSYPFLKISTTIWKLKYVNMYAALKDVTSASHVKQDFKNKYGVFHYLSWNAAKWLNLGLFESIIWQGTDSNRVRNFDVNYLNPVIFYRPVEYSLGSSDNAFLGFSFRIKTAKKLQLYGQLILDEFLLKEVKAMNGWWANKQGGQFGIKCFDLFTIKNLYFHTELNMARPYTYSHGSVQQNYGHYNQPLTHPLGANFAESVSFLNYHYKKWMFETEFLFARYGKDENGKNWGQDIFQSYSTHPNEYGNKFFQGMKTDLLYTHLKAGYYLIPAAELLAEAGVAIRQEKNYVSSLSSNYFFIGIKTGIMNRYTDF